jgi:hypothetical protein
MIAMTQDQYGQARGPGYVVRGDVVPENETEEVRTDESKPMTRFQKVASALRGTDSERDEQDQAAADRTPADPDAPTAAKRDYWDDPDAAGHEDAVAVTSPGTPADHAPTEPDMFGTTRRTDEETAEMPAAAAQAQPGAATIADVPAARTPMGETTASGAPVTGTPATAAPAGDVPYPAGDVPATAAEAAGSTGRHAAGTPAADGGLRPGEAAGNLGDFSDLTYGNLVPDAEQFTAQWQEIQFRFVDDPRGSVTQAADVVAQVTAKMEAAIQERQRAIEERQSAIAEQQRSLRGRWGEGTNADTEALRETLRMYKTFLDQLIGSRAS